MQCHQKGKEINKQSEVNNVARSVYSQLSVLNYEFRESFRARRWLEELPNSVF